MQKGNLGKGGNEMSKGKKYKRKIRPPYVKKGFDCARCGHNFDEVFPDEFGNLFCKTCAPKTEMAEDVRKAA
jgi:transcription elongation factor Elf1